mmetsp:Transcript_7169/g.31591  ORF Transcript_7169/g.31591 Transcript_7169/m.31591 type:complete len:283 (-) Transcript_7169:96-944(-)
MCPCSSSILFSAWGSLPLIPTTAGPNLDVSIFSSPSTTHSQWCMASVAWRLTTVTTTFFDPSSSSISHTQSSGLMSRRVAPSRMTRSSSPGAPGLTLTLRCFALNDTAICLARTARSIGNSTTISSSVCFHVYRCVVPPHSSAVRFFIPPLPSCPTLPPACSRAISIVALRCISNISSGLCPKVWSFFASSPPFICCSRSTDSSSSARDTASISFARLDSPFSLSLGTSTTFLCACSNTSCATDRRPSISSPNCAVPSSERDRSFVASGSPGSAEDGIGFMQ